MKPERERERENMSYVLDLWKSSSLLPLLLLIYESPFSPSQSPLPHQPPPLVFLQQIPLSPLDVFYFSFSSTFYLYILYPVSQSVSNYWSLRQMFGESFSCAKFFRRLALPPPVHLKHLLRLIFPFQNVFNCRTFAPTGQSNDVGHNMCEHLFRGHLP